MNDLEYLREWRRSNPGYSTAQSRRWRKANKERSLELNRQSNRRQYTKARLAAIEAYGGACDCCGENDPHFLQLDHRNEMIPEHHRDPAGRRISGMRLLKVLRDENYPDYMRLLCGNCNFARGHYGFCPHEAHEPNQRRYAA